jgi:hypothetical protein
VLPNKKQEKAFEGLCAADVQVRMIETELASVALAQGIFSTVETALADRTLKLQAELVIARKRVASENPVAREVRKKVYKPALSEGNGDFIDGAKEHGIIQRGVPEAVEHAVVSEAEEFRERAGLLPGIGETGPRAKVEKVKPV